MKKIAILFFLAGFVGVGYAQNKPASTNKAIEYAATITAGDLSRHLHILAADSMQGRNTGETGQKMAADYIASQFFNYGLKPVVIDAEGEQNFYQAFELVKRYWGDVYVETGTQRRELLKDFYVIGTTAVPSETSMEVVFAGYGIEAPSYSDYQKINVKDKAVLILSGEPADRKGISLISGSEKESEWATDWRKKLALGQEKGAKQVFIVTKDKEALAKTIDQYRDYFTQPTMGFKEKASTDNAAFFVSPEMAAEMLGIKEKALDRIKKRISRRKKSQNDRVDAAMVSLKADRKEDPVATENVLGLVEGTDKKDEIIVITAHYDHVGVENGEIYNGADDDGSGTSAVLEMAEAFAQAKGDGQGPRRSVLFMTVTGEEKGLLGSEYYTENPVFPLSNTIANLNIDMIGRIDQAHEGNANYIYLIGSDKLSSELHRISEEANKKYTQLQLDYTYNDENDPNRFYYRSDHYNFAKNRIPVIFYFNGVHEDYHKPTDDVDKINFNKMEKITRLVFHTAWDLANRERRIVVDSSKK